MPAPPRAAEPATAVSPTFSVIVAAYQAAGTIGEALAPVFEETVPADVCDDGSMDGLREALVRDRVTFLSALAVNPSLTTGEQRMLARSLRVHKPQAKVAEAEAAIRTGFADARRRALSVSLARRVPLPTRDRTAACVLAPRATSLPPGSRPPAA